MQLPTWSHMHPLKQMASETSKWWPNGRMWPQNKGRGLRQDMAETPSLPVEPLKPISPFNQKNEISPRVDFLCASFTIVRCFQKELWVLGFSSLLQRSFVIGLTASHARYWAAWKSLPFSIAVKRGFYSLLTQIEVPHQQCHHYLRGCPICRFPARKKSRNRFCL